MRLTMTKRKIIKIDESRCDGCGLCVPNCQEGALKIINGKARLVSEVFCDGLGACLGHCPKGAITIEERDAQVFDEKAVAEHLAHSRHSHGVFGCPGARVVDMRGEDKGKGTQGGRERAGGGREATGERAGKGRERTEGNAGWVSGNRPTASQLANWPVQIMLVPPTAPYLKDADILVASDCVPFAYADFHGELLKGKALLVGCPKLDDIDYYKEKILEILKANDIKSITCARMEVPCCSGLIGVIEEAIAASGKKVPFKEVVIGIKGRRLR
jgi:NAD-dependent dihydropyrimidine dehydrogenase PreA subunit